MTLGDYHHPTRRKGLVSRIKLWGLIGVLGLPSAGRNGRDRRCGEDRTATKKLKNVRSSAHSCRRIPIPGPCPLQPRCPPQAFTAPHTPALHRPNRETHCQSPNVRGLRRREGKEEGRQARGGWEDSPDFPALRSTQGGQGRGAGGGVSAEPQVLPESGNRREKRFPFELETGGFQPPKDPSPKL